MDDRIPGQNKKQKTKVHGLEDVRNRGGPHRGQEQRSRCAPLRREAGNEASVDVYKLFIRYLVGSGSVEEDLADLMKCVYGSKGFATSAGCKAMSDDLVSTTGGRALAGDGGER